MSKRLPRLLILGVCVLLAGASAWAKSAPSTTTAASKPAFAAPAKGIDRIMLTWSDDPATSQSVTWRTDKPCEQSQAQFAVSTGDPKFGDTAITTAASNQTVTRQDDVVVYYHRVDMKDLKPATVYAYRVGDGKNWSEWNQFQTADTEAKPFKFLYMGDAQNDIKSLCSRVFRAALLKACDARFILHAGDMVTTADNDDQWSELFETAGWAFRTIPSVPVIGNHEQPDLQPKELKGLSVYWRPQFAMPENGPEGLKGLTYFIRYQGALIVVLNGTRNLPEQAQWLDKVLSDNHGQAWTIVAIHQPFFSTGKQRTGEQYQQAFLSIVDKHKVDLVLQGHDHTYARSHKLQGGQVVDAKADGTVYCISVVGTKQYAVNPINVPLMSHTGSQTQLFQVISVDGGRLDYQSWTASGELFDSFSLVKDASGASELIESPAR